MNLWTIVDLVVRSDGFTIAQAYESRLRDFVKNGEAELKREAKLEQYLVKGVEERRSEVVYIRERILGSGNNEKR